MPDTRQNRLLPLLAGCVLLAAGAVGLKSCAGAAPKRPPMADVPKPASPADAAWIVNASQLATLGLLAGIGFTWLIQRPPSLSFVDPTGFVRSTLVGATIAHSSTWQALASTRHFFMRPVPS